METKVTLTSTKAGRRFMGFMFAFNSGNADRLKQSIHDAVADIALEKHAEHQWYIQLADIYHATQGLKAVQVIASDEYKVIVLMQAHKTGQLFVTEMTVEEEYPHKIAEFKNTPA